MTSRVREICTPDLSERRGQPPARPGLTFSLSEAPVLEAVHQ
jgi:hypothetical protein